MRCVRLISLRARAGSRITSETERGAVSPRASGMTSVRRCASPTWRTPNVAAVGASMLWLKRQPSLVRRAIQARSQPGKSIVPALAHCATVRETEVTEAAVRASLQARCAAALTTALSSSRICALDQPARSKLPRAWAMPTLSASRMVELKMRQRASASIRPRRST